MTSKYLNAAGELLVNVDDQAQALFEPYANSPAVQLLDVLSKVGDQPALRLLSGALMLAGTFANNDRLVCAGARMMIAHEAATAAKDVIKTNIDRKRPRSADESSEEKPTKGKHTAKEKTSFPSGHSAGAMAAARAFAREYPEYGVAAIGAAIIVAVLQVPRSAHYPTDVVAGLSIGLVAEAGTNAAWNALGVDERSTSR